ncbi:MAG: hypothetical protein JRK53_20155 [Deltaproteobacteria bacterium]|nr:hypothetical protein [Deltaproteobacteria bacterium]
MTQYRPDRLKIFAVAVNLFMGLALLLAGCVSQGPYRINLMPAPEVYDEGKVDPFAGLEKIDSTHYSGIFYATDREPADEGDQARFYKNKRGHVLRLGLAQVELSDKDLTWEEARRVSLLKNRTDDYPLGVENVEETGVLEDSLTLFDSPEVKAEVGKDGAGRRFAEHINRKLAESRRKDIYIYVHGYKI